MIVCLDSQESLNLHYKLIREKKYLKKTYINFYQRLKRSLNFNKRKKVPTIVELGSGAGFIKDIIPNTITSDVIPGTGIDKVFSADKIPFKEKSVDGFVMLDVFHHIKNVKMALKEISRCLSPGGKVVMIEPCNSIWARFIFQNFHHEKFDPKSDWEIPGKGRLTDANGALPWIIFVRDRKIFEKNFPTLRINKIEYHTPFQYLISGGLSKPQILPSFIFPAVQMLEKVLSPLQNYLSMYMTVELKKIPT